MGEILSAPGYMLADCCITIDRPHDMHVFCACIYFLHVRVCVCVRARIWALATAYELIIQITAHPLVPNGLGEARWVSARQLYQGNIGSLEITRVHGGLTYYPARTIAIDISPTVVAVGHEPPFSNHLSFLAKDSFKFDAKAVKKKLQKIFEADFFQPQLNISCLFQLQHAATLFAVPRLRGSRASWVPGTGWCTEGNSSGADAKTGLLIMDSMPWIWFNHV